MQGIFGTDCSTYVLDGKIHDPLAAAAAGRIDVPADVAWLRAYPKCDTRERPVSWREKRAYALPDNANSIAWLADDGMAQIFTVPKEI